MKQYIYRSDTIEKTYLASYANAMLQSNKLIMINTLTDEQVQVYGDRETLKRLITELENGIEENKLCRFLEDWGGEKVVEYMLQKGLIE